MRMRANFVTERLGVNHARTVVERAGSLFKEINLQHDFGHDATIVLVVNGVVRPREVALQIKSGASYVSGNACRIPATAAHIHFWAEHDLVTLGMVFDPTEGQAYWMDLQIASKQFRQHDRSSGTVFTFPKTLWNRFDHDQFPNVLLPTLLGEAPHVAIETLIDWVRSDDLDTHDLGVRVIRARHFKDARAWDCLIEAFKSRPADQLTMNIGIALSKLLGHDDLGYYSGEIPAEVRAPAVAQVVAFGAPEIAKALALIEDGMFDRPSDGYSLLPVLAAREDSVIIWSAIRDDETIEVRIRQYADGLLEWYAEDTDWFKFWRRG